MSSDERKFMEMAIEQARAQLKRYGLEEVGERPDPKVGCVVVTESGLVEAGYRGELEPGEHAEFTVMEKKLPYEQLAGATVYTTLEPCTDRKPPQKSCADRLIERRVGRVVIGILDPDDRGQGYHKLLDAKIAVEPFPQDLVDQILEMNRRFIESRKLLKSSAVRQRTRAHFLVQPTKCLAKLGGHTTGSRTQSCMTLHFICELYRPRRRLCRLRPVTLCQRLLALEPLVLPSVEFQDPIVMALFSSSRSESAEK